MESCPPEILHAICSLLASADTASFRVTSKCLAAVGAHYLVRNVTFHLSPDSLERLEKISDHPVLRQHVTSLIYEAATLYSVPSLSFYTELLKGPADYSQRPKSPPADASPRELRLYERNERKWRRGNLKALSERQLEKQFNVYSEACRAQNSAMRSKLDVAAMSKAIPRFPRLQSIHLYNSARCRQSDLDNVKNAIREATEIDLNFRVEEVFANDLHQLGSKSCYAVLENGKLRAFLESATHLEKLRVAFGDDGFHGPTLDLKHVLGTCAWPSLSSLSLDSLDTTAENLVDILKRQPSLKNLRLGLINLSKGTWTDVLDEMRVYLDLEDAHFWAFLTEDESGEVFNMSYIHADCFIDAPELQYHLSEAIEEYVCASMEFTDFNPLEDPFNWVDADDLLADLEVWNSELEDMMDSDGNLTDFDDI